MLPMRKKKSSRVFALAALVILCVTATTGYSKDDNSLSFLWAFAALTGDGVDRRLVQVTKDTTLKSGDQLKMMVELNSEGYIYVLYNSSNGELVKLFPDNPGSADSLQVGTRHFLPEGNLWFTLDEQTGLEKFYLIASQTRLVELEKLLVSYENAPAAEQVEAAKEIRKHIIELRKEKRKLATVADRPVEIGGNIRSVDNAQLMSQDISLLAMDISGSDFFARTFTIEHQ